MNARLFRSLETRQRVDCASTGDFKRRRPDPVRTTLLRKLKLRAKALMLRLSRPSAQV